VSFLYDVAGRSEDAFFIKWKSITNIPGGKGKAWLKPGKTSKVRTNPLSPLTMDLLKKFKSENTRNQDENLFDFKSADSLAKNLDRKIKSLKLPVESSIDVMKWHCHSLRTSMLT